MPHRRKGRRFSLLPLSPDVRIEILQHTPKTRRLVTRLKQARTPAALAALCDPRRQAATRLRRRKGCLGQGAR